MCGINGIFAYREQGRINPDGLRRTRDTMTARGPDGFGEWLEPDGTIGFGHRRLAIIDLSPGGAQPMASADGQIIITFNGEIYNFRQLRGELEASGAVFRSQSDTEVLLHLYREYGTAMLPKLRGMFAFALWDAGRRVLLLARDPYGIKPLYYADDGRSLRFASSVKALVASGEVAQDADPAGLAGFHIFGSVPEPWTCYKAIKAVPAGSWMEVSRHGTSAAHRYFSLAEVYCAAEKQAPSLKDANTLFRASMLESVRHHLVADVPVGLFLSAGVDSGALLGLMRDAGQTDIRTLTLAYAAFAGSGEDESPLAEQVAGRYGASHVTRRVGADEFAADLPKIMAAMDQPSIDGINTWFVSKAARELGLKVALSGVGGDELLGGYSTFARLPRLVRSLRFWPGLPGSEPVAGLAVRLAAGLGWPVHPKAAGVLAMGHHLPGAYLLQRSVFLPHELKAAMADAGFARAGLEELQPLDLLRRALVPAPVQDFSQMAVLESSFYLRNQLLRDSDWAGMAHSVEIRTPLVDSVLLGQVAPVFARVSPPNGKALLAQAPGMALPAEIVNRPKSGFGIPLRQWLHQGKKAASDKRDQTLWSRTWLKQVARSCGPAA